MPFPLPKYLWVVFSTLFFVVASGRAQRIDQRTSDEENPDVELLKASGLKTDAQALIDYLAERTPKEMPERQIKILIKNLGAATYAEREKATRTLFNLGMVAAPLLREASNNTDPEIADRAKLCLKRINSLWNPDCIRAIVRLLGQKMPAGADELLLRFLPFAEPEELAEEIWFELDLIIAHRGLVPTKFHDFLGDPKPIRRAAAAFLMARRGNLGQRSLAKGCLSDRAPLVRLRVAQGLLGAKDKTGIPNLIALLEEGPLEIGLEAEELLRWVAADESPRLTLATESPKPCRDAWAKWWQLHGSEVDLISVYAEPRRPLFLLMQNPSVEEPSLWVCGCDGALRWQWRFPPGFAFSSVQLLSDGRLLIAQEDPKTSCS
jgi:HEAT repeat protein